ASCAIDLGRRNMHEATDLRTPRGFEEPERGGGVDFMVLGRMADRMSHAAAGGMEDNVGVGQQPVDQIGVADVAPNHFDVSWAPMWLEFFGTTGGKMVEYADAAILKRIDEMRADEAGSAGDQDFCARQVHGLIPNLRGTAAGSRRYETRTDCTESFSAS